MPSLDAQAGALWSKIWSLFYTVDDHGWAKVEQAARLRELCRLCAALAAVCDQIREGEG